MKLLHLSDLHLGIRINGFSMLEDQSYILGQILEIAKEEKPQAVLLCGDLYDKAVPPSEAVQLLDSFLVALSEMGIRVFAISGNHDSAERLSFGSRLMAGSGVYMAPVYHSGIQSLILEDEFGPVYFWMIPFVKPAQVRRFFPEEQIESYTDALERVIGSLDIDKKKRNVLLAHQFVTDGERSESEDVCVGGLDNVDSAVFDPFDYVALGHLHRPQHIGRGTLRYCGTPLKYSFSEKNDQKSVTVVELGEKGNITLRACPLRPLRDLRELRGTYEELTLRDNYMNTATQDYIKVILTDEEEIPSAMGRLRNVYPNIMSLQYDNTRTRQGGQEQALEAMEDKSPLDWFRELYRQQNGRDMSEIQQDFCRELIEKIGEERL